MIVLDNRRLTSLHAVRAVGQQQNGGAHREQKDPAGDGLVRFLTGPPSAARCEKGGQHGKQPTHEGVDQIGIPPGIRAEQVAGPDAYGNAQQRRLPRPPRR